MGGAGRLSQAGVATGTCDPVAEVVSGAPWEAQAGAHLPARQGCCSLKPRSVASRGGAEDDDLSLHGTLQVVC